MLMDLVRLKPAKGKSQREFMVESEPVSEGELVHKIIDRYPALNLDRASISLVIRLGVFTITDLLCNGKSVHINDFGFFYTSYRKGEIHAKFKTKSELRNRLKNVKLLNPKPF